MTEAEKERAEIVAWLRAGAGQNTQNMAKAIKVLFLRGLHSYADAIEALAHKDADLMQDDTAEIQTRINAASAEIGVSALPMLHVPDGIKIIGKTKAHKDAGNG